MPCRCIDKQDRSEHIVSEAGTSLCKWSYMGVSCIHRTQLSVVILTTHAGNFASSPMSSVVFAASLFDIWAETRSANPDRLARVKKRMVRDCGRES
jgi:hypothetical protein